MTPELSAEYRALCRERSPLVERKYFGADFGMTPLTCAEARRLRAIDKRISQIDKIRYAPGIKIVEAMVAKRERFARRIDKALKALGIA